MSGAGNFYEPHSSASNTKLQFWLSGDIIEYWMKCGIVGGMIEPEPNFLYYAIRQSQKIVTISAFDELVKSQKCPRIVIPVNPGSESGTGIGIQRF